jgi:DNA replicative helicase MCM subunit Mcm2 (Cdc46/Mcm family)
MAALYNAMEKGFVTYDKGGKHLQVPARVRVCATANPIRDTFIGKGAETLKKQVPFGDALLTRFHLVFLVRKPTTEEFGQIAHHIIKHTGGAVGDGSATAGTSGGKTHGVTKEDAEFIKAYVDYASTVDVRIDPAYEQRIVDFVKELKADERKFIVEIGPRTVVGIVRVVKAVARAHLETSVTEAHLDRAFALLRTAMYVREPEPEKQTAAIPTTKASSKK